MKTASKACRVSGPLAVTTERVESEPGLALADRLDTNVELLQQILKCLTVGTGRIAVGDQPGLDEVRGRQAAYRGCGELDEKSSCFRLGLEDCHKGRGVDDHGSARQALFVVQGGIRISAIVQRRQRLHPRQHTVDLGLLVRRETGG